MNAKTARAAETATETAEAMAAAGKETLETVMNMGTETAAEGYKNAAAAGKEGLEITKAGYEKFLTQGKENLDAVSAATATTVAGLEAYFEQMAAYTKTAMAENVEVAEKAFAAKTPQEFFEVQMEAMNKSFSRVVGQSTKLQQIGSETAAKSFEPIKAQIDRTADAFVKPFVV